jgi:hypothetical protein
LRRGDCEAVPLGQPQDLLALRRRWFVMCAHWPRRSLSSEIPRSATRS